MNASYCEGSFGKYQHVEAAVGELATVLLLWTFQSFRASSWKTRARSLRDSVIRTHWTNLANEGKGVCPYSYASATHTRHDHGMSYKTDLTDRQWELIKQVLSSPSKRGRRYSEDTRKVVNALLYLTHTGCQWRYLPEEFGPWTRVWSQFRRWCANDTLGLLLAELHKEARIIKGRGHVLPSLVVVDTHLARGASNGGVTFHNQGGPRGWTKGAKRVVAVDVTGLPLASFVVPAGTTESTCVEELATRLVKFGQDGRLEVLLADKDISAKTAKQLSLAHGFEVRRYGWGKQPVDPATGRKVFKPLRHAWKVEAAHAQIGKSRRLSKSFENTDKSATAWLNLACVVMVLNELR